MRKFILLIFSIILFVGCFNTPVSNLFEESCIDLENRLKSVENGFYDLRTEYKPIEGEIFCEFIKRLDFKDAEEGTMLGTGNDGFKSSNELLDRKYGNCQSYMILSISFYGIKNLEYITMWGDSPDKSNHVVTTFNNGLTVNNNMSYKYTDTIKAGKIREYSKISRIYYDQLE